MSSLLKILQWLLILKNASDLQTLTLAWRPPPGPIPRPAFLRGLGPTPGNAVHGHLPPDCPRTQQTHSCSRPPVPSLCPRSMAPRSPQGSVPARTPFHLHSNVSFTWGPSLATQTENGPICSDHRSLNHSSRWPSHHEPVYAYETTLFLSPLPILEGSHTGARTWLLSVNASAAQRTNTWDACRTRLVSGHAERRNKGERTLLTSNENILNPQCGNLQKTKTMDTDT